MATLSTNARNSMLTGTGLQGTIGNGGKVKLMHSDGTTILATFTQPTSQALLGTAASGVSTFQTFVGTGGSTNTVSAGATGTATTAKITTSADVDVITGLTVGTSGTQVIIDNTSITSGQNVTINFGSCTITQPAS